MVNTKNVATVDVLVNSEHRPVDGNAVSRMVAECSNDLTLELK